MPRVLIADDHAVIRRGVRWILQGSPEWELCGEAEDGQDAVRLAEELQPEIIILDVSMPRMNGVEAARVIRRKIPEARILLLTLHASIELIRSAFRAGVRGYVLKSDAEEDLVQALGVVIRDGTYVSPRIDQHLVKQALEEFC
jgi:DNA-binding NarL/FixJ family response regulator